MAPSQRTKKGSRTLAASWPHAPTILLIASPTWGSDLMRMSVGEGVLGVEDEEGLEREGKPNGGDWDANMDSRVEREVERVCRSA